ncbi:hypothetical protein MTO96_038736 [Rhipicephalus appendiculatus]
MYFLFHARPEQELQHDVADARKVFANFVNVVAIFDIDKDGDLDCLAAVRTDYDKDASTATYVWLLKGLNGYEAQNISYEVRTGPKTDQFLIRKKDTVEDFQLGTYDFSDNKNCVVMEMPYHGSEECVLWVTWKAVHDLPQYCLDHYEDNCEDAKLAYDKETCGAIIN